MSLVPAYLSCTSFLHSRIQFWSCIWCSRLPSSCQRFPFGFTTVIHTSIFWWLWKPVSPSSVNFLHCRFRNMGVLRDRLVSPLPNSLTWRTGGSCFVAPLSLDLFSLGGPTRRRSSRRHSSRGLRGTQAHRPRQGGDPSGVSSPVAHLNLAYILRLPLFYCWCHW